MQEKQPSFHLVPLELAELIQERRFCINNEVERKLKLALENVDQPKAFRKCFSPALGVMRSHADRI